MTLNYWKPKLVIFCAFFLLCILLIANYGKGTNEDFTQCRVEGIKTYSAIVKAGNDRAVADYVDACMQARGYENWCGGSGFLSDCFRFPGPLARTIYFIQNETKCFFGNKMHCGRW
jgi:hypothetical protein